MGAGASAASATDPSVKDVSSWSKEEVGDRVAAIGEAFESYRGIAISNGVDGKTLLDLLVAEYASIFCILRYQRPTIN